MILRCVIPLASFELNVDVSFDARVTSIFGPSGSGKTTLLEAIAGLKSIAEGEIEINGKTLFSSNRGINLPPQERFLGYVPQEGALFPHLSVKNNILFGANRLRKATRSQGITMDHVMDVLEIRPLLNRPATTLSGGEAQRVALGRAILSLPQLLLLDEPLAALDIGLKERILPYLARVRDEFSIPMIYVTHNLTEVLTLADWVLMIRQGKLIAQGVPRDVLRTTLAIMQMEEEQIENVFNGVVVEADPGAGRSKLRLESGLELLVPFISEKTKTLVQVGLSADDILLGVKRPEGISAGNTLRGIIRHIDSLDGQALLTVDAGDLFYVRLTAAAVTALGLAKGKTVFLIIKARSFRLL